MTIGQASGSLGKAQWDRKSRSLAGLVHQIAIAIRVGQESNRGGKRDRVYHIGTTPHTSSPISLLTAHGSFETRHCRFIGASRKLELVAREPKDQVLEQWMWRVSVLWSRGSAEEPAGISERDIGTDGNRTLGHSFSLLWRVWIRKCGIGDDDAGLHSI
nr:hypothetical protein CFP56_21114 [Quercus suber]